MSPTRQPDAPEGGGLAVAFFIAIMVIGVLWGIGAAANGQALLGLIAFGAIGFVVFLLTVGAK